MAGPTASARRTARTSWQSERSVREPDGCFHELMQVLHRVVIMNIILSVTLEVYTIP